jgi:hypothetical protein
VSDDERDLPLSPRAFEAIGRLAVACTYLDARFTEIIATLSGLHILDALKIVHHQQFASKHSTLCALLSGSDESQKPDGDMMRTINRAKEIYDFRSALVHGYFTSHDGKHYYVRFDARGRLKRRKVEFSSDEALRLADEAFALSAWLDRARERYLSIS